jgi:HD superfamily phosphohydrolase
MRTYVRYESVSTPSTVRDPIHGMIELSPPEWGAVDTPVFQRLRRVRQLAMTHLVYPGATHTRFEHSIGVCEIAGRFAKSLKLEKSEREVVRTAALLHDVGHGVFSHVSEQVIDELSEVEGVHEAVSVAIMRSDEQLRGALGGDLCDAAADIVAHQGPRTVARDIVSGPTDADKFDYLLRDSYFAGVNYGRYDLARLIDTAKVITPRGTQTQLGFDADGLWAVEEMRMARHHMHRQVYGHKTRIATDIMVTRALRLAIAEGVLPESGFKIPKSESGEIEIDEKFLDDYLAQTDAAVLEALCEAPDGSPVRDLGERLRDRRLLRQTVSIRLDQERGRLGDPRFAFIRDPEEFTRDRVEAIEAKIAAELGLSSHLVALQLDSRTNPTYRTPGGPLGPKDIMIQRDDMEPMLMESESEIFTEGGAADLTWLHLYTPGLDSHELDDKAKEMLWEALLDL